jgi:GNAT superfamily N-acetyltransferase
MIKYSKTLDYLFTEDEKRQLIALLSESFPGYFHKRIYHKNVPTYRYIVQLENQVIGQVGIEYRVINSKNNGSIEIFGITDLCIKKEFQNQGIGKSLLSIIEEDGKKGNINALILFADNHALYLKEGYRNENVSCKFLAIEDLASVGIIDRNMNHCFLVKTISPHLDFTNDNIDMLGYIF